MTLLGTIVGRIRIVETLRQGGMGEVFVGYDETLKRKVALKAIRGERRFDAEAKARFLREARILSQLDHPGICQIHELVEGDGSDFLVLELIAGKTLRQALDEDSFDMPFKLHVAERVTEAQAAAHAKGVAHRDLKPDNVMITPEGGVKVLDFGIAYNVDEELVTALDAGAGGGREDRADGTETVDLPPPGSDSGKPQEDTVLWSTAEGLDDSSEPQEDTVPWSGALPLPAPPTSETPGGEQETADTVISRRTRDAEDGEPTVLDVPGADGPCASDFVETQRGMVIGTVAYMSPEQARGERVTVAGDMYSLGLLLQELFTGKAPYPSGLGVLQMLHRAGTGKTLPVADVDPDLGALIEQLKSLAPGVRPTAAETGERLRWIRGKPGRRLVRRLATILLLALVLGGLKYTFDLRRERIQAEAARREAEEVAEFLVDLFSVSDPENTRGDLITARELLDAGAERIATELSDQPRSQARLMFTMDGSIAGWDSTRRVR